ncbi:MAG: sulfatase [Nitrospirae bacterium]|nr:sulfatase [Nitrospirota bacterium]
METPAASGKAPDSVRRSRFAALVPLSLVFLGAAFVTRLVLLGRSLHLVRPNAGLLLKIFGVGFIYDCVTLVYAAALAVFILILIPERIYRSRGFYPVHLLLLFGAIFVVVFSSFAEYIFFDEYGTRFNFIAVDYLVYTTEVVKNIWESYPLTVLLSAVFGLSSLAFIPVWRSAASARRSHTPFLRRVRQGAVFVLLPLLPLVLVDQSYSRVSSNMYANELAANGIYNLFAAFRNNEIDYESLYATWDNGDVFTKLRGMLKETDSEFVSGDIFDISRDVREQGQEKRLNVVTIIVESLSAEYLGVFGNRKGLTPNLDALAGQGLLFTHLYATGTRTDRGLEAITLSVPPTPGRSIVKRRGNEGLFSWGSVMRGKGYDTVFMYGGYGYFDNMNYFFSHNGYRTIDRKDIAPSDIHFENAWGVCDEDLFAKALREFDIAYRGHRPFFAEIMTTSNHRPYTYPEGRIDIPSHSGRDGAVKYTDYAIGKFIDDARKEPWFRDTVFVIVADHCANSAGKTALPVKKYEIPLIVFSPAHIQPARVDRLASQIDVAPTVLDLLNFSYADRFFGRDILHAPPQQERAFIGTYQKLGYIRDNTLVILEPRKDVGFYRFDRQTGSMERTAPDREMEEEAISYYEGESYLFRQRTGPTGGYADAGTGKRL